MTPLAVATTSCQTLAGNWDDVGWPTTITQDGSGNLTVSQNACPNGPDGGPCSYTGTGQLDLGTGSFQFTVTTSDPSYVDNGGGSYTFYVKTITYSGNLQIGCNEALADYEATYDPFCLQVYDPETCAPQDSTTPDDVTKPCDMPTGETTVATGYWDIDHGAAWNQTLLPTTWNFGGRYVTEEDPDPNSGTDSCWFNGSQFDPFTAVTGGTWNVDSGSVWGSDYVGYKEEAVTYYRSQARAPCGARFRQLMYIGCSDQPYARSYITNQLGSDIDLLSVTSWRAGWSTSNSIW